MLWYIFCRFSSLPALDRLLRAFQLLEQLAVLRRLHFRLRRRGGGGGGGTAGAALKGFSVGGTGTLGAAAALPMITLRSCIVGVATVAKSIWPRKKA